MKLNAELSSYLQHHRGGIEHPKWCNLYLPVRYDGYALLKHWWHDASEFDGRVERRSHGRIATGKVLRCWRVEYYGAPWSYGDGSASSVSSANQTAMDSCQPDVWYWPLTAPSEDWDDSEEQVVMVVAASNQPAPLLDPPESGVMSLLVLMLKLLGFRSLALFYHSSVSGAVRRGLSHQLLFITFEMIKETIQF